MKSEVASTRFCLGIYRFLFVAVGEGKLFRFLPWATAIVPKCEANRLSFELRHRAHRFLRCPGGFAVDLVLYRDMRLQLAVVLCRQPGFPPLAKARVKIVKPVHLHQEGSTASEVEHARRACGHRQGVAREAFKRLRDRKPFGPGKGMEQGEMRIEEVAFPREIPRPKTGQTTRELLIECQGQYERGMVQSGRGPRPSS